MDNAEWNLNTSPGYTGGCLSGPKKKKKSFSGQFAAVKYSLEYRSETYHSTGLFSRLRFELRRSTLRFLVGWDLHQINNNPDVCLRQWTKIPDPPIHFSGPTIFFGPKIDFTNHQFETSVLDPPMSSDPLSNHQCLPTLSRPTNVFRPSLAVFRICKRCGDRESRREEQQEQCQPREHLFIGDKGSTRLYCTYFPIITRWPSGDCFFALPRFGGSREGRKTLVGQERWFQTGGW